MDPITLSTGLAALLTPYLSYLLDSAGKRLSSKVGDDLAVTIETLWGRLWPKLRREPAGRQAVQVAEAYPKDKYAQAQLATEIERLLHDRTMRAQINEINDLYSKIMSVIGNRNAIQYGKYNMNIDNMHGGHIGDRYG